MCNKPEKKRPRTLCEMRRWSISVFLALGLCGLLIGSIVLLLHGHNSTVEGNQVDVPLHPISSSSYSKAGSGSGVESSHAHPHHEYRSHPRGKSGDHDHATYHDNYRKRFSDAIKGVFTDLYGKNSSHANQNENPSKESKENSSRLKRQLDFGSASEEQNDKKSGRKIATTNATETQKKSTTRNQPPILRLVKIAGIPVRSASSISDSSSSSSSSSSEETKTDDGLKKENGKYQRKAIRRTRPKYRNLASVESDNDEYDHSPGNDRKNFTFEVVQVKRKVVRKEDGHIPSHFAKSSYRIEPRLKKVSKKDINNKPSVIYRRSSSPRAIDNQRASRRLGKASQEVATERSDRSTEDAEEEEEDDDEEDRRENTDRNSSQEKRVVINSKELIPHHERDLSDEDLKDYHDGHSTFGSKGNFTHTIISRNVAGFLPNPGGQAIQSDTSHELSKRAGRSKDARKIVIERGQVREKYAKENSRENSNPEVYSVPGGRTSSTENYESTKQAFPFERNRSSKKGKDGSGSSKEINDRTSPVIRSSLEELYRKGHPGVVRAPRGQNAASAHQRHELAEPYGESADEGTPFGYNPLVDEPPLKFDPASDRFYGNPVPDNKERVAQSNSPVRAESRNAGGNRPRAELDYLKPAKRSRSTEDEDAPEVVPVNEEGRATSSEAPQEDPQNRHPNNDRFYYGRAYNSPDYTADYDNLEQGVNRDQENDLPSYDFVGLDESFDSPHGGSSGDEFFDFPGGNDFRPRAGGNSQDESSERPHSPAGNDYDGDGGERQESVRPRPPPAPPSFVTRHSDVEYDNNDSRERGRGGFRPVPNDGETDDEPDQDSPSENDETGFIETLKQFDEEIRKLQHAERKKLLDSPPITQQQPQRSVGGSPVGYKGKEPPLIITSPGPLENSYDNPTEIDDGDHGVTTTLSGQENEDVQQQQPDITEGGSREDLRDSTVTPQYDAGDDGQQEHDEEEEEENTNRSVGAESGEHSTERSAENQDDETKKK